MSVYCCAQITANLVVLVQCTVVMLWQRLLATRWPGMVMVLSVVCVWPLTGRDSWPLGGLE